jgi:hypothetical protein
VAPFSFPKGGKVFNGTIACNFFLSYLAPQEPNPPKKNVKCKIWACTIECKRKREREKAGRGSKVVPKGMQSMTKLQKVIPKGAQRKFSAQKLFLR